MLSELGQLVLPQAVVIIFFLHAKNVKIYNSEEQRCVLRLITSGLVLLALHNVDDNVRLIVEGPLKNISYLLNNDE